ncbi:hypothetical protein Asfd1_195 [Aeromonas phage Asfd_1]|nr:hypothetical protein Asfd1_195 [Aeromonas phage Asfd_1]
MTDQQEMTLQLQPSAIIKVWCEYDINGGFGGNNNEEVFQVILPAGLDADAATAYISSVVEKYIKDVTGLDRFELEDMFDWSYHTMRVL